MKQKLLNKFWLRVWMLVAVMTTALAGTATADKETLVSGSGTSGYAIPDGWSSYGTVEGGSYLKFDNGGITSPEFAPHTELSFTYTVATFGSGTNHPLQVKILDASTEEVIYQTETATPTSSTYINTDSPLSLGDVSVPFKIQLYGSTGKGVRLRNYSITGTPAGGGSSAVATTTTISADITNTNVHNGTAAGSLSASVTETESGDAVAGAAVTWSGNNDAVATINASTGTVTLIAAGTVTFTATYAGVKDEYESSSDTYELTVTDSTPIPTHTATFSVNGVTSTQDFEEGADIVFPNDPADISGKIFVGWVTEAIDGTTNDAPEFVTSATMDDDDVTFYAVFAYASGSGSSEVTKSYGFETESDPDWTIDGPVRTANDANTGIYAGKISSNNTYVTFKSKVKVKEFSFAFKRTSNNNNYNVYIETSEDNSNWTAAETYAMSSFNNGSYLTKTKEFDGTQELYVRFHCSNTTAVRYVDDVTIKYGGGGGVSYSDYCTTVAAATVARPTIEVAANPFLFSTTATITCETEGAAIKYSFDGENWNDYTDALTITATTTVYAKAVKDENESQVASVTITKNLAVTTVAIDATGITNTNVFDGTEAGSLAASVTYNDVAIEGAVVSWSGNNDEVATIDEDGVVTLVGAGSVTFTATYAGNGDYAEKTATYEMTVTNSDPNAPGTENNPYTVAQAIEATPVSGTSANVYIRGIVSAFYSDDIVSDGNYYRYYISDDGTTDNQLLVFRGKGLNNETFSSADDLQIGDEVVILGGLTTYSNAPEVAAGNYIVSLDRPVNTDPVIAINPASINATAEGADDTVAITFENLTISDAEDFDVQYYDSEGEETDAPNWILVEVAKDNGDYVVSYMIDANDGEARTAYFKVYAMDNEEFVYSNLVTVSQDAVVVTPPDYVRITSLNQLVDGCKVIIAARYDEENTNGYYAMPSVTSGKPNGVAFTSETSGGNEILPAAITTSEDSYYWTVNVTEYEYSRSYTFTNASGQKIGYTSGTNFTTDGNNTEWTISRDEAEETAMVPEYEGFVIRNGNTENRAFAFNGTAFGPYATSNMGGGVYNFFLDFFMQSETVTLNGSGYATYASTNPIFFPEDGAFSAWIGTSIKDTNKGTEIHFDQITGDVSAGVGVLLTGTASEKIYLPIASTNGTAPNDNLLVGITEDTPVDAGTYYGLKGDTFKRVNAGTVPAGKALLPASVIDGGSAKEFLTFVFEDDATGIENVNDNVNDNNAVIYNLAGQRISKMQKGINIVNGKKILK